MITDENFDIAFLSETWFRPTGDESDIVSVTPPGYTLQSFPRLTGAGGGLAVVYRDSLAHCLSTSSTGLKYRSFEACKTCLTVNKQSVIIFSIYRPPPSRKNGLTNKMFVDDFTDFLEVVSALPCDNVVIAGDINFHFDSHSDPNVVALKNMLHCFGLDQLVNVPTHRRGHTLDWIVANPELSLVDHVLVEDKAISDHFAVSFSVKLTKPPMVRKTITSRCLRKVDSEQFKSDVSTAVRGVDTSRPDQLADSYNATLKTVLDKHAPVVTRRVTDRPAAPWMTAEIIAAKQQRRRAERKWRKTGLTVHRQIYAGHRNTVSRMIRDAKRKFLRDRVQNASSTRELFSVSNEMLGVASGKTLPSSIPTDKLPDTFNKFFSQKIETMREKLDSHPAADLVFPDPPFSGIQFENFEPVTMANVKEVILKMPKKSCQLDPIPSSLFFDCLDELLPTITDIMNASLSSGTVPSCFKHAIVIPLLKKTNLNPEELKNYRPVSNLPFLSKVLERIVLCQFMSHLERHDLLEPFQSAYRKGHSTETALVRVFNDLLLSSDQGMVSILSLLDLSAAFDTIDHDLLCRRLQSTFGCTGTVLEWFRSYLSKRTQAVFINEESNPSTLKYGVPQGSVLGPILFTVYMKPLSSVIKPSGFSHHSFADDTQMHNAAAPPDAPRLAVSMAGCIDNVGDWMIANKLMMNDVKTEAMLAGSKRKKQQVNISSLSLSHCEVRFAESVRNLGVHIDQYMTMDAQVSHLCKVLNFHLRRIGKIRQYLTVEAASKLAVAFILSRLDYCNALLAGLPDAKLAKLQRIQNRTAKMVLCAPRHASATALLKTLHWLPVKARIEYKIAIICFQCLHSDTVPSYLSDLVSVYQPARALRSQDSFLLHVPRFNLKSFGARSFSVCGPVIWNSLPLTIRLNNSLCAFKTSLKTHLFQKYLLQ